MKYADKLRHPLWQKKRLEILERDKFTCQKCWDNETELHIHHSYYKNGANPWEYENDSLSALCKYCHAIVEHLKTLVPANSNIELKEVYKEEKGQIDGAFIALFGTPKNTKMFYVFYRPTTTGVEALFTINSHELQTMNYMHSRYEEPSINDILCRESEQ